MKILPLILFVFGWVDCNAQFKILFQSQKDTTKYHVLKLQRNYNITTQDEDYTKIWLYSATDSSLVFLSSKKEKIPFHINFSDIKTIDKFPLVLYRTSFLGVMLMASAPIVLLATPFVGILDNWQSAKDGLVFSGVLAVGGLVLCLPRLLYKSYDLVKEWKLVAQKISE